MKIFVTGGTGFIGSHFIKKALDAGHQIVALRRKRSILPPGLSVDVGWVEAELDTIPDEFLKDCDALLHFAAQGVSPQMTDWKIAFKVNVFQSISLFSQAQDLGIPHLISCGSCFEYGKSGERYEFIPANAPLEPIGPYPSSKATFSIALEAMARSSDSSISILRPFHLYGEGQHSSNLWPSLRSAARAGTDFPMTEGEQIRDYMPVVDAASMFLKFAEEPPRGRFNVENVGSGDPISIRQFAEMVWKNEKARGKLLIGEIPYRENEIMRYLPYLPVQAD